MKVIFIQDVPKVAKAGDIKEVANGYGRNYLIPKNLATLATPAAVQATETRLKIEARTQEQREAELVELAKQIDGKEITLEAQAGGKDRLYGSITTADIAAELQNTTGVVIDKKKIGLDKPIHQLGNYDVVIRLGKDITPKVKINVVEKETEKDERGKATTA